MLRFARIAFTSFVFVSTAFAGDVQVTVASGSLTLIGTPNDENLSIDPIGVANAKEFRVVPGPGTTVNGQPTPQLFPGVTKNVVLALGAGTNSVTVIDVKLPRDLIMSAGPSGTLDVTVHRSRVKKRVFADTAGGVLKVLLSQSVIGRRVQFTGGAASDELSLLANVEVRGDVEFSGGGTDDVLDLGESHVRGGVEFTGGAGDDVAHVMISGVEGQLRFDGGDGEDNFQSDRSQIGGPARLSFGANDDSCFLSETSILGSLSVALGDGTNDVLTTHFSVEGNSKFTGGANDDHLDGNDSVRFGGALKVDLGAGANSIGFDGVAVEGSLRAKGGIGLDAYTLADSVVVGDARLQPSPGASILVDTVAIDTTSFLRGLRILAPSAAIASLDDSRVAGSLVLRFGLGTNSFTATDTVTGGVNAIGADGPDTVQISNTSVLSDFVAKLGNGANFVRLIDCGVAGDVTVRTGSGDDTIEFDDANIVGKTDVNTGTGTDTGP